VLQIEIVKGKLFMRASDTAVDPIAGLHRVQHPRPVHVIAVTSGKGGVGKTNVSVNLSLALQASGKKTMLLDADLGLGNVDVLLGLSSEHNLSDVINGRCSLEEIILSGPAGLRIVPAASGIKEMTELGVATHAGLIRAFSELTHDIEVLVIDTAAGISDSVVTFAAAAQDVVVVLCDEPTSITDAYAVIKLLSRDHGIRCFRMLCNMTTNVYEGRALYEKLLKVCDRFLEVKLEYFGAVPQDEYLRRAVQKQRAIVDLYPRSRAAQAFRALAERTSEWPTPKRARGHLEFFFERLILPEKIEAAW
jgi:flagellar biosynthesis protein FlhG